MAVATFLPGGLKPLDPSFEVRSMATKKSYIAYPADMVPNMKVMQREYDAADVIHHRNKEATWIPAPSIFSRRTGSARCS